MQHHLLAVDVAHLQMAQFVAAHPGGIERSENRPMFLSGEPMTKAAQVALSIRPGNPRAAPLSNTTKKEFSGWKSLPPNLTKNRQALFG
jgi:hypothetical protein